MTTKYYVDSNGAYQGGFDGEHGVDVSAWTEVDPSPPYPCCVWVNGGWTYTKTRLKAMLAEYRYNKEIGGIVLGGLPVPTDDRAKTLIAGKYSRVLEENDPTAEFVIKVAGQFMTITNEQLIAIFNSVNIHVQKCFDSESVVYTGITNDTLTTPEQVYGAFDDDYAS